MTYEKNVEMNNFTGRHFLDPGTRLYFSEVFWCAESESDLRIVPPRQVFEKSYPKSAKHTVFLLYFGVKLHRELIFFRKNCYGV